MNYKSIISFFVLFVLKESLSSETTHSLQQYNITKRLDEWFEKLFRINVNLAKDVRESFGSAVQYKMAEFEYNLDHEVVPFENKFIFQFVTFYRHYDDDKGTSPISQMSYNFLDNKISVLIEHFRITLETELRAKKDTPYEYLFTTLNFRNFTLTATRQQGIANHVAIDINYDHFFTRHYGLDVEIKWSGKHTLEYNERARLGRQIEPALVALLREHINRNEKFSEAFSTLFNTISEIKTDITSTNPDILNPEQRYFYHIPHFPFYLFTLKNIQIQGLYNIESISLHQLSNIFTRTILLKDIRGNMILDYGSAKGASYISPLELTFKVDYLTISVGVERNCIHPEARYFSVNSTTGPLTPRQSTTMMQSIESAIVSSIMPLKKELKMCDIERPIDMLKISNKSNWKTIKETYKEWIPFREVENHDSE